MVLVPLIPSAVAVIVADPACTPVTSPVVETVATNGSELDQATVKPVSSVPFASLRVADNCSVSPTLTGIMVGVTVTEAIETRNIAVHNRCIINKRYVTKTRTDPSRISQVRRLQVDDLSSIMSTLSESVRSIDKAARSKLTLKARRFDIEQHFLHD